MHAHLWGGYHYRITGKNENNEVSYEGGWQNNRQMGMHKNHRFVENIFEELDAPGEWFHDRESGTLYYIPEEGLEVSEASFEGVRLDHLVEFQGSEESPVRHVELRGFTFQRTSRTFMKTKEPLLRSDWTIYRGGAVVFQGSEDCTLRNCHLDQVGGNGVFVNLYNRRVLIEGCHIEGAGASGVCFVGDPKSVRNPLFEYHERQNYKDIDLTPGPLGKNFPEDCQVTDSLIHSIGVVEKQAAGVQISMSRRITVSHTSIYKVGRAGINVSEGTFGGHLIEYCDVFDTVLETSDHGSFNSWGRDRFWELEDVPEEKVAELAKLDNEKSIIRNSRWRCDHGWDIDLDDGSSNYEIYNNLMLSRGLKLREGFHRKAYNNITINNSFHPHVWYKNSEDVITGNIWHKAYRPIGIKDWGNTVDKNFFLREGALKKVQNRMGVDKNSLWGDPHFIDPAKGDYRVSDDSPAKKMGFKNFPMDQFGVKRPELKAIARTPELPDPPEVMKQEESEEEKVDSVKWNGLSLRGLEGEEFSAFGTRKEDGGLQVLELAESGLSESYSLEANDLIQKINDVEMVSLKDLGRVGEAEILSIQVVRGQKVMLLLRGCSGRHRALCRPQPKF